MMTFTKQVSSELPSRHTVVLSYHQRVKGRLRITTQQGQDAGILIERGNELKHGDKLSDDAGNVLEIYASNENVSVASTNVPLLFARACYHVGNRHAEVQIESDCLIYLRDAVMDDMLRQLGLKVTAGNRPFSPENGAYAKGHSHTHSHSHSHSHDHDHADIPGHAG